MNAFTKLGILATLSISSALAADFTTFQDPSEKAFTLDVPKGWTVKGGMFRLGYSDTRVMVDMQSPDGKINVRLGDVTIPMYFIPNQYHPREGEIYDLGAQAQLRLAKYRSGPEYAMRYAAERFKGVCPHMTLQAGDAPVTLAEPLPPQVAPKRTSVGQATYACDSRVAFVYSKTFLLDTFWYVGSLGSYVAPQDQTGLARTVLLRAAQSLRFNPEWLAYQKKVDAEALEYQKARQQARMRALSQEVAQFEAKMHAMQSQVAAFERHQAAQAAQVEAWGNILTGITPTTDPMGNPRTVWTGPKSGYWTDGNGRVVNSDLPPGPGWQPLTPQQ